MKTGSIVCAGEEILSASPFVQVVNPKEKGKICDHCFQRAEHIRKCTGCGTDFYCSVRCQRADWRITHKIECPLLKKVQPHSLPEALRMLAKLALRLSGDGGNLTETVDDGYNRKFADLITHVDKLPSSESMMEEFVGLRSYLFKYLGPDRVPNNLLEIYGAMTTNSYSVTDEQQKVIGSALCLIGSIFDHSCHPNAAAIFCGTKLKIKALEEIQDFSWDKIHISYIEMLDSRTNRRLRLQQQYRFDCHCRRCDDPAAAATEDSLRCGNPSCSSSVPVHGDPPCCPECGYSDYPANITSAYRAMTASCSDIFDEKLSLDEKISLAECKTLLQSQQDLGSLSLAVVAVGGGGGGGESDQISLPCTPSMLSGFIESAGACLLHPLNVWRVRVLDAAFEAAIAAELIPDALKLGLMNVEGMKHYNGENHPSFGYFLAKIGKLCLYWEQMDKAVELLTRAVESLTVCYGQRHSLTITVRGMLDQATQERSNGFH